MPVVRLFLCSNSVQLAYESVSGSIEEQREEDLAQRGV